jgi:hypothetical protein
MDALEIPSGVFKNDTGRWVRFCPGCGEEISHARRNYCIGAHNIRQICKKCSNISNNPAGMIGSVRLAWYNSFYKSAISRGYNWELTPEFVDVLYQQQNSCCALSGLPIYWSEVGWDHTASLDRIDNDLGYTEDNVQLVHKRINMMRGTLSVDEFKELCSSVASHSNIK